MKLCFLDGDSLGTGLDLNIFSKYGTFTNYETSKPEQVAERIKDCTIVLTNKVVLTKEDLSGSKVELIAISATGANVVDLDYCSSNNIAVCNVAGYSTHSVAQHTIAMVLSLLENLSYYDKYTKSKEYLNNLWATHLKYPYYEIEGKNWGIIGLGNIGQEVAKIAQAFGAKVSYYSTTGKNHNPQYNRLSLEELLNVSDIISLHAPLSPETHHLLGYEQLCLLKSQALVCNVSRGALVDEEAMARALNENRLRGFATDVYSVEPPAPDFPLYSVKHPEKLLMTPHMAFCSTEARTTLLKEMDENIQAFLQGKSRNRLV